MLRLLPNAGGAECSCGPVPRETLGSSILEKPQTDSNTRRAESKECSSMLRDGNCKEG